MQTTYLKIESELCIYYNKWILRRIFIFFQLNVIDVGTLNDQIVEVLLFASGLSLSFCYYLKKKNGKEYYIIS